MIVTVFVWAAFLLAAYFPLMLAVRSPTWRDVSPTRALMVFSVVVAFVLFLAVLRRSGVHLPEWIGLVSYGLIVVGLLVQDVALTKTQNRRAERLAREREESSR